MKTYKTDFNKGLKLKTIGGTRLLPACQWHDDPLFVIEGRRLKRFGTAKDETPNKIEELASGTEVRIWDEDNQDPLLGTIE